MIDPRVATLFALGAVPYFDEVLITASIINPGAIKPDLILLILRTSINTQTLKNLLLLLYLEALSLNQV